MILYFHDILNQPLDEFDHLVGRISAETFSAFLKRLHQSKKREWIDFDDYLKKMRARTLSSKAVCLSFDDAALGIAENGVSLLNSYGKQVALMVPSAPYVGPTFKMLPHQWVEGVFRFKKLPVTDFKRIKKELKKAARAQGLQAYLDWLKQQQITIDELFSFMAEMKRFQFIPLNLLSEIGAVHKLCRHGHLHLPLGPNKDGPILADQLGPFAGTHSDYYALPYGDLIGELPLELKNIHWVFGTEGPYEDKSVIQRVGASNLGEEFF